MPLKDEKQQDTFVFNGVRMRLVRPRQLISMMLSFNIPMINYCRSSVIKNILKDSYHLVGTYCNWWKNCKDRSVRVACNKFFLQEKKFLMSLKKYNVRDKNCRDELLGRYYNEILTGEGLVVFGRGIFERPKKKRVQLIIDTGPYWRKKKRKRLIFLEERKNGKEEGRGERSCS